VGGSADQRLGRRGSRDSSRAHVSPPKGSVGRSDDFASGTRPLPTSLPLQTTLLVSRFPVNDTRAIFTLDRHGLVTEALPRYRRALTW
jgi:hypothetical protein